LSTFIIFGATGAVGGFLLPRLLATGAQVHAVSRNAPAQAAEHVSWIQGDLAGDLPLPAAADCIVSLGPLDTFAGWFERSATPGVRRVIALSSMSAETKRTSHDPAERALAERLRAAETRLIAAADARAIAWTVFRPTLIYGDGRDRSLAPIARFARRWRVMPVPISARGLRQPVHAADLAQATVAAIDCAASFSQIYALGGGERLPFDDLLRRLRAAIPGVVLPLPVPLFALHIALRLRPDLVPVGRAALRRLSEPLIADNSDAAADFGYAPREFVARDVLAAAAVKSLP
jgi:nucleoside-diphosphate-sugar epimerase